MNIQGFMRRLERVELALTPNRLNVRRVVLEPGEALSDEDEEFHRDCQSNSGGRITHLLCVRRIIDWQNVEACHG